MYSKDQIEKALSKQRLTSYDMQGNSVLESILSRYEYNVRLSNALYPTLHFFEVTLRNSIEDIMLMDFGPNWFSLTQNFRSHENDKLRSAIQVLQRQGKSVDSGRVVAELHFGFWTSIFDRYYDDKLWHQKKRLKRLFPFMQSTDRTCPYIRPRLEKIRRLRNRVFHYETIFHWKDLKLQHDDILMMLLWLNKDVHLLNVKLDDFSK